MSAPPYGPMLRLAKRLAIQAAEVSLERVGSPKVDQKQDGSVVTDVDREIQTRILSAIAEGYPDHAAIAEESVEDRPAHADPKSARFCWVIDPIDGTRNYVAGLRCFATSIAVLDQGRPILAVTYEHNLKLMFVASKDDGATLNGTAIQASVPPDGADLIVAIPTSKDKLATHVAQTWAATRGLIPRNFGTTATHLGLVASGALSGVLATRAKIWDVAAGALLVSEAGGRITDPTGGDLLPFDTCADPSTDIAFLAGAPSAHARLLTTIS